MRAVVYADLERVRIDELAAPEPRRPGDAVVRVTCAGICGSDLHFFHGKAPLYEGEGMGHEAVGVVEAVGAGVRRVREGDRVVVAFTTACGACWFCRTGATSLCDHAAIFGTGLLGGRLPGAQAERLLVPEADVNLLRIPEGLDDERAVFVADVATTAVYAATLTALTATSATATVAVVGLGPVGSLSVQALRAAGVGTVAALDRDRSRLAMAEAAGATPINVDERHPEMAVAELTDDRGADVAIDAVGHPDAYTTALDVVRRGGEVVVIGMYSGETVETQLGVAWSRGVTVRFAGVCPVHAYWERTIDAIAAGDLDPAPLVSHRLPLEEAQAGYELFARREATKVLLIP
jgi:threonine dehydrogenase-like Zn-dependent dehydrogenase